MFVILPNSLRGDVTPTSPCAPLLSSVTPPSHTKKTGKRPCNCLSLVCHKSHQRHHFISGFTSPPNSNRKCAGTPNRVRTTHILRPIHLFFMCSSLYLRLRFCPKINPFPDPHQQTPSEPSRPFIEVCMRCPSTKLMVGRSSKSARRRLCYFHVIKLSFSWCQN